MKKLEVSLRPGLGQVEIEEILTSWAEKHDAMVKYEPISIDDTR